MNDVRCSQCGQSLYYTGGCLGEWEHRGECPADYDNKDLDLTLNGAESDVHAERIEDK